MSDQENQIVEPVETVPVETVEMETANIVVNTMLRTIEKLTRQLDNAKSMISDLEQDNRDLKIDLDEAKNDNKKYKNEINNLNTVFEALNEPAKKKDSSACAYPCYGCNMLYMYDMSDGQGGICMLCNRCADCGCKCDGASDADDEESDEEECECGKNEAFDSDEIEGLVICPVCTETYLCNACIHEQLPEDAVCKKCRDIITA